MKEKGWKLVRKGDKVGKEQELKLVIKIVRGNEQSVRITGDLCDPHFFMHASYQQALRALAEIVRQTDNFHKTIEPGANPYDLDVALFCYNDNIILFEGSRGRGKTQTMLSFTRILRNASEHRCHATNDRGLDWNEEIKYLEAVDRVRLADTIFHVIPPISPSVLEEKQNILFLILSRLYDYAVNLLENARNYDEDDRNKLSRLFSACLSGIKGIKQGINENTELLDLQTISDGAALRNHFYSLVQFLIQIDASKSGAKKTYLVIQIDDADSQIKNGYKAIEDIRKYLLIPNLVIVMSADITFLHKVIIHEQGKELDGLCHKFEEFGSELSQMSRKYIDKLIPPSHMIHLPKLEHLIENNPDSVVIKYIKEENTSSGKEESIFTWMKEDEDWDIQNMLFMLIFRKTGVVFVRPAAYLHNIVPRSIRGLNQMLYFLSSMEDIPSLKEDAWTDSPTLALRIQEQLRIAMPNLEAFERYFCSDWIEAKFHHSGDRQFIRGFIRSAGSNRVRLAIGYLQKRYSIANNRFRGSRIGLDAFMAELETEHREQEDFLLFFSIRTVLSLASHRRILQCKRKQIEEYFLKLKEDSESDKAPTPMLVFDYDPKYTFLPETYMMPRYYSDINILTIKAQYGRRAKRPDIRPAIREIAKGEIRYWQEPFPPMKNYSPEQYKFLGKCMLCENETGNVAVHFLNLITFILRIGCTDQKIVDPKETNPTERKKIQSALYHMQEAALLIASNWDIQGYLYKYLVDKGIKAIKHRFSGDIGIPVESGITENKNIYSASELYRAIDNTLNEINSKEFRLYLFDSYYETEFGIDTHLNMLCRAFVYLLKPGNLDSRLQFDSPFAKTLVGTEWSDFTEKAEKPEDAGDIGFDETASGQDNLTGDDIGRREKHEELLDNLGKITALNMLLRQKHDEQSKRKVDTTGNEATEKQQ